MVELEPVPVPLGPAPSLKPAAPIKTSSLVPKRVPVIAGICFHYKFFERSCTFFNFSAGVVWCSDSIFCVASSLSLALSPPPALSATPLTQSTAFHSSSEFQSISELSIMLDKGCLSIIFFSKFVSRL